MNSIAESELILDKRGAIYHLGVKPEEIATTILLVGDPERVQKVSRHFDRIEFKLQHREFITHTGYIGQKRISVLSTGIGPDNIDIAINEIDALTNIDFESRTIKPQLQSLNLIRLGTSGALQGNIPVDSFVAGTHGLGFDNVMHFYKKQNTTDELELIQAFQQHTGLISGNVLPYVFRGSDTLRNIFKENYTHGITIGCPGFFGPQGRILRLELAYPGLIDKLTSFKYQQDFISNFEMESSAIYGLCRSMGHQCVSLNVIVANRVAQKFSSDSNKAVEALIKHSIELLADNL
ncbi:MAG TPA: nucleoside phosphorylase [Ferruginibacter sp.]|nr:nucleoside phosphorylase [Ferruginibacter sp.]HRE63039.1 nucleoside phosphorylase [Ferruginibacter sp.]